MNIVVISHLLLWLLFFSGLFKIIILQMITIENEILNIYIGTLKYIKFKFK